MGSKKRKIKQPFHHIFSETTPQPPSASLVLKEDLLPGPTGSKRPHTGFLSEQTETVPAVAGPSNKSNEVEGDVMCRLLGKKIRINFLTLTDEQKDAILGYLSEEEDLSSEDGQGYSNFEPDDAKEEELLSDGSDIRDDGGQFSELTLIEPDMPSNLSESQSAAIRTPVYIWYSTAIQAPKIPFTATTGLKVGMKNKDPWAFFKILFTDPFLQKLVEETNLNAETIILDSPTPQVGLASWRPVTLGDLYIFLGLLFHMGDISCSNIRDYWRTDQLYHIPFFVANMGRERFEFLLRALYFNRRRLPTEEPSQDRVYKLRSVLDHFNDIMTEVYYPAREISIDESMLWRDPLVFRQYVKSRRHKYGIKLYTLTDDSGMVSQILIYTGAADTTQLLGTSHVRCIVDTLMNKYRGQGHSLLMGNFFTSVPIVSHLLDNNIYCTGTLTPSRVGNPKEVTDSNLKKGEIIQQWNDDGICVFKWKDKRDVCVISSEYSGDLIETQNYRGQVVKKPLAVVEYNKHKGDVDQMDQLLSYNLTSAKAIQWYKKIAFHIMKILLNNAFLLYKKVVSGRKITSKQFREEIIYNLVNKGQCLNATAQPLVPRSIPAPVKTNHYPDFLPFKDGTNRRKQKDCRQCTTRKIRKSVNTYCPDCPDNPGLCIGMCYKEYHEKLSK